MTTSTITQGTSSDRTSVPPPPAAATRVRVAVVAAAGLMVLAAFQFALALGAPWGEAAYGGLERTSPWGSVSQVPSPP